MIAMLREAITQLTLEFVLRKRLLKRLWGILILEVQNAESFFKKFEDTFKA